MPLSLPVSKQISRPTSIALSLLIWLLSRSVMADELFWAGVPADEDQYGIYAANLSESNSLRLLTSLDHRVRDLTADNPHTINRKLIWLSTTRIQNQRSELWYSNFDGTRHDLLMRNSLYMGSIALDSNNRAVYIGTNYGILRLELVSLRTDFLLRETFIHNLNIDPEEGKLFWIAEAPEKEPGRYRPPAIWTSNLNAEDPKVLFELRSFTGDLGLTLDTVNKKIYWAAVDLSDGCNSVERIQRANYDGTEEELVFCGGPTLDDWPSWLAANMKTSNIVWHNGELESVFSVETSGENNTELFKASSLDAMKVIPASAKNEFVRGDVNQDGQVEMTDAINTLQWLFLGENTPRCKAAADIELNGEIEITDSVLLLSHLFLGGPGPAQPYPDCGGSSLESDWKVGCEHFPEICES